MAYVKCVCIYSLITEYIHCTHVMKRFLYSLAIQEPLYNMGHHSIGFGLGRHLLWANSVHPDHVPKEQSDQGLHWFIIFLWSSLIRVYTIGHVPKEQSDQGLHYLSCSKGVVWSRSTVFVMFLRSSLIRDYTICHVPKEHSDQGLHFFPNKGIIFET